MLKIISKNIKPVVSAILLIFALVSIGYMLGKNSVISDNKQVVADSGTDHIAVYYMHSTFRCETCNTIEAMTQNLLDREFISELDNGELQWHDIDFIKNDELAKQFEVSASCVVVVSVRNGEILDFQRLDEVWTLMKDPDAFDEYIRNAILFYLDIEVRS